MYALVTGAGGFIGTHLTNLLIGQGARVRAMVRSPEKGGHLHPEAERAVADMADLDSLRAALTEVDTVFHLAGVTVARTADDYYRGNADIARNLAEGLKRSGVKRLVQVSSLAAAGPCNDPRGLHEDAPPRPVSAYGRSKLAAEEILRSLTDFLHVTVIRPPAVYGPRDIGFLPMFKAAKRHVLPVHGFSPVPMSVIHAEDLAACLYLAATGCQHSGQVYHVSDGTCRNWEDIAREVGRALGTRAFVLRFPLPVLWLLAQFNGLLAELGRAPAYLNPDKFREAACSGWTCDPGRAARELDFSPRIGLEQGLRETARWYRDEGWL